MVVAIVASCSDDASRRTDSTTPTLAEAFVEGDTQWLTPPSTPTTRSDISECGDLAAAGWEWRCGRVTEGDAEAIWLHERRRDQDRVLVYVRAGREDWHLALRASDEAGDEFFVEITDVELGGSTSSATLIELHGVVDPERLGLDYPPLEVYLVAPNGDVVINALLNGGRSGSPDARPRPGVGVELHDCPVDCVPTAPLRTRVIAESSDGWQPISG